MCTFICLATSGKPDEASNRFAHFPSGFTQLQILLVLHLTKKKKRIIMYKILLDNNDRNNVPSMHVQPDTGV